MNVLLIPNFSKCNTESVVTDICGVLAKLGVKTYMSEKYKSVCSCSGCEFTEFFSALDACDIIIAVGGDGTIIHSAKHAADANKPILGVNVGRLGFLASLEPNELDLLRNIVNGDYEFDKRMMLKVTHTHACSTKEYTVFNDAAVTKGALSKIVDLSVECNGDTIGAYRADGLIFSTPSGGTGYSLSAGGPIVDPSIDCIIMTPICPHSLFDRSIIFSPNNTLSVRLGDGNSEVFITVDGENVFEFCHGDVLTISKSELSVKLINIDKHEFYDVINKKFLNRR